MESWRNSNLTLPEHLYKAVLPCASRVKPHRTADTVAVSDQLRQCQRPVPRNLISVVHIVSFENRNSDNESNPSADCRQDKRAKVT